ncbi:1-phosphofructokinase family hexose kinase [Sphingobium sp. PNB]|uniref:1-phosphofructokinase family hexose kinase n=1 Tax=Sphingobium sp. PNB TaxID=863934 RepID=UPI001CA3B19E|nr:1-phosphofructokinase family hexose kinase [Sphingobium sp. PNB]MCB4858763.1 1-phosphofructokinase family hexose kinase [Sphingobium sp. PNB]
MKRIATLTMNPAIDVAYEADRVFHTHKIRARQEHYDPGGGGINVARVIARLGGTARAHYLAGGATGATLDSLLDLHQMVRSRIPIQGNTRISTAVYERETGKEFRFVPRGPVVTEQEWQACLDHLDGIECDYLVASGSLPPGVPDDFYSRLQTKTRARGIEFILDSSGAALQQGLAAGGILLVKPSLGELQQLVGRSLADRSDIATAASDIVHKDQAQYVAVTMGHEGGLLAQRSGVLWLPAVPVEAKSAVGAGDSFLAAMTFALACGRDPMDAFRYGIAAGAAAVLTPGTDLCHRDEVERLYVLVDPGETPAEASTNMAAHSSRAAEAHRA